jgi:ABC-type multidrug transport system permease subunit
MVGMYQGPGWAGTFFQFVFSTFLLFLAFISIGMMVSSFTPGTGAAGALSGAIISLINAVAGVAITWPNVPAGYRWLYRMLPASHLLESLIMPQFVNNDSIMTVFQNGADQQILVKDYVADYLGWTYDQTWNQIGWAVLFIAVTQVIAFTATTFLSFNKR